MRIASIHPRATDEEVAAIGVAFAILADERSRAADMSQAEDARRATAAQGSAWVHTSRRAAQRAGLQRGPWRLSGRIGRRSRI